MNLKQLEKITKSPIVVDAVGEYAEFYLKDIVELIEATVREVYGEKDAEQPVEPRKLTK